MPLKKQPDATASAPSREDFDALCRWIDANIGRAIGWQDLMAQSRLEYQAIQSLFFEYESTTAFQWIRQRRAARSLLTGVKVRATVSPIQAKTRALHAHSGVLALQQN